jgi:hypothetical protein
LVGRDMLSSVPASLFQHLGFRQAECRGKCGNRDRYLSGRRIYDRGDAKRRQQLRAMRGCVAGAVLTVWALCTGARWPRVQQLFSHSWLAR